MLVSVQSSAVLHEIDQAVEACGRSVKVVSLRMIGRDEPPYFGVPLSQAAARHGGRAYNNLLNLEVDCKKVL